MAGAQAVTHVRVQKAGAAPVVRPLAATLNVAATEQLVVPANMFDVVYPDGQLSRSHMRAMVDGYWDGEEFQVDCMTDDSTPVDDSGYAQQAPSGWSITEEAD